MKNKNTILLFIASAFVLIAVRGVNSQQTTPVVGFVTNNPNPAGIRVMNVTKHPETIEFFFKLGGGVSAPIEKEGIYNRDLGYNLNIGAGYAFTPLIGGRFDIDYDLFRDPNGKGPSLYETPQFYMLSLKLGVMAGYFQKKKSIKLRPYGILGFGFHHLTDLDSANVVQMPSENDFSVFFGGGLCYMFTPEGGLFIESEYQSFLSGDRLKANIPMRFGIFFCPAR